MENNIILLIIVNIYNHLGPNKRTAFIIYRNYTPIPIKESPPVIPIDVQAANMLPAATLPIIDYAPAAKEPLTTPAAPNPMVSILYKISEN